VHGELNFDNITYIYDPLRLTVGVLVHSDRKNIGNASLDLRPESHPILQRLSINYQLFGIGM